MTDAILTTMPHDKEVELRKKSAPDVCGFQNRKSSELLVGKAPVHEDSDNYNMEHPNRGTCLVFNHAFYDDETMNKRIGTYADVQRIEATFKKLGFYVDVCNDYNYENIKKKITTVSKENHDDNDCLCVIALTHGQGDNTIQARDKCYPLNALWEPFTANNCITLAGKPKLFFISACRGVKRDKGVRLRRRTETDGHSSSSYVIPTEADFLFGFSTPPGYVSWRSLQDGTWYIQSLCDVLDNHALTSDLVDILTKTAQEVTKRSSFHDQDETLHNKKQVPEFHSRLLRRVYFITPKKQAVVISESLPPKQETLIAEQISFKPESVTSHSEKSKSGFCIIS